MGEEPRPGDLPLFLDGEPVGAFAPDRGSTSRCPPRSAENLPCLAGAVHATRFLLATTDVDPLVGHAPNNCGEEAIGDRYQRGGSDLAKAVAEAMRPHRGERRRHSVLRAGQYA